MAKTLATYSETIAAVYHPEIVSGELTRVLKGVFVQGTEVIYDDVTGVIERQTSAGQREANSSELKEFFNAENADLITQAQAIKKDYEAKEEANDARIKELEAENAALTAIVEAL